MKTTSRNMIFPESTDKDKDPGIIKNFHVLPPKNVWPTNGIYRNECGHI